MTSERYNENHIPGSVTQAVPNFKGGDIWIQLTERSSTASHNSKTDIHWHSRSIGFDWRELLCRATTFAPTFSVSTRVRYGSIHLDLCSLYMLWMTNWNSAGLQLLHTQISLRFTSRSWPNHYTFINYVFTLTSLASHTDAICCPQETPVRFELMKNLIANLYFPYLHFIYLNCKWTLIKSLKNDCLVQCTSWTQCSKP